MIVNSRMKCVILVAGHGTLLENEIREKGPKELVGVPKALLVRFAEYFVKKETYFIIASGRKEENSRYLVENCQSADALFRCLLGYERR